MGKLPFVSVIVPTKNASSILTRLLESIRKQTYKKLEIIVVDNNSSDDTLSIARQFTTKVYTKGPERSAQRNYGASHASGKYLLFLDADMQLSKTVVEECVKLCEQEKFKLLVIPEKTVGSGFFSRVRQFEREMYMGDLSVEVARFFDKKVFDEAGGYDLKLTGPEDYDLPYRISKKYSIGRTKSYLYHHEKNVSLRSLLKKKYYYASHGAYYAKKHPELVWKQGALLFRKVYFKNWKKFVGNPVLGLSFLAVRTLETIAAVLGYISAVGLSGFLKTMHKSLNK